VNNPCWTGWEVRAIISLAMSTEPGISVLYSREQIAAAVERLQTQIADDYSVKYPLLIGVLEGSFLFGSDAYSGTQAD